MNGRVEHHVHLVCRCPGILRCGPSLMIKATRAAIESVDRNLINASYTLGHSEFETAMRVTLPLAKRGIVAGAVLSFARAMGEFGATLMIAGNIREKRTPCPSPSTRMPAAGIGPRQI